jgi:ribonuclease BN (tRNA processing enzyme)
MKKTLLLALNLLLGIHSGFVAGRCDEQGISLQVLGSGGPELDDGRASSSYLIWQGERAVVMIDAGSGSALNFEKSGARFEDMQALLFTHLHVDHSSAFAAYIKGSYFTGRDYDLRVLGPAANDLMPSTSDFVQRTLANKGVYPYLQDYLVPAMAAPYKIVTRDLPIDQRDIQHIPLTAEIELSTVAVHHGPVAALAWRVNIGSCSITFSGDMNNDYKTLARLAHNSDLLVMHNAVPESATGAATRLHMRPSEIGKIARAARVRRVLVSHRMNRTTGKEAETLRYIRQSYTGPVSFAEDLDRLDW